MNNNRIAFVVVGLVFFLYYSYVTGLGFYESCSIGLLAYFFLDFLDNVGKRVVVLDIAVILALFTWLVMPVIFYQVYTKQDHLAFIFRHYMPIPADDYFSFAFPGTISMIIGFKLPLAKLQINQDPQAYKAKLQAFFKGKARIGFILIGISFAAGVLYRVVPASLNRPVNLLQQLSYVGVFYIFFSEHKHKNKILLAVLGLLAINSIIAGLFGELVFLVALFYILIALYLKKISFGVKLSVCLFGFICIFLIQNVKKTYRQETWSHGETNGSVGVFWDLVAEAATNPSVLLQKDRLYFTAVRMNQGWLIAETMYMVPARHEYAHGETIATSVLAAFIPRFLWPDKPEAGGKYNLMRFWGFYLRGYSENIGPIGEAYANFGRQGAIIFMFFYGLFFNGVLTYLLRRSEKRPSILCWIPFLFFYAVVVETDILTTVGSIVTSLIFMTIFSWLYYRIFHVRL
ncbi:hypothetical protein [Puia dinghuensis]|uniref:Oligosaccharide repeat unit polymerase n=1 Tax=Puia dinghuensis TaxID=1792502 RepID=A0A8J2XSD8_9BACT|nr:hypothetical protein [Puia dinghuensis]GGB08457.1 hypothetical protein GCM10011511_34910 [Puia dinghuensis]